MSRKDREAWAAQLAADPALKAAWQGFSGTLKAAIAQVGEGEAPDLDALHRAADQVMIEAGGDQSRH